MKNLLLAMALALCFTHPALAKGPRKEVKQQAQKFCKDQGLTGPELKACIKDQMKKSKKKRKN